MKILTVVGARPQFIKAAVLRRLLDKSDINEKLLHTGQHYDHAMSDVFFDELGIKDADYKLNLSKRSHAGMTAEIMFGVEEALILESPNFCLLYGDTNSTLAAAIAASKMNIPICHVESGQRSFNSLMPEETNRLLTDHVSKLLFCSTTTAVENLRTEGITTGVHHVGDIMFDAVKLFSKTVSRDKLSRKLGFEIPDNYILTTIHRAETLNDRKRLNAIIEYVKKLNDENEVIFVLHPHTKKKIESTQTDLGKIKVLKPQTYLTMQSLISQSNLVVTDSGGMQKEAYFHKKRCITLRDETEWVETIDAGWNRLWTEKDYKRLPCPIPDYGDGNSGKKIIQILNSHF